MFRDIASAAVAARLPAAPRRQAGIEGLLLTLAPGAVLAMGAPQALLSPGWDWAFWRAVASVASMCCCLAGALSLSRNPGWGRAWVYAALGTFTVAATPLLAASPSTTLLWAVVLTFSAFFLRDVRFEPVPRAVRLQPWYGLRRARWAAPVPALLAFASLLAGSSEPFHGIPIAAASIFSQGLLFAWLLRLGRGRGRWLGVLRAALVVALFAGTVLACVGGYIRSTAVLVPLPTFLILLLFRDGGDAEDGESVWASIINHPERSLITTFIALGLLGTVLLLLPIATRHPGAFAPVDAAFMALSAVCVTGLSLFELSAALAPAGQFFMMLLIQLGGLGIMSSAAVFMHVLGRRISLRQEVLLSALSDSGDDSGRRDLMDSLMSVVRVTFAIEGVGACLLTLFFAAAGMPPGEALWQGCFIAVSAFCNAGFTLGADSMVAYRSNPFVLHTVALLIICGGLAPAVVLALPRWLRRRPVPLMVRMVLATTLALLLFGTVAFLALEWNGCLGGLPVVDKVHNAWFQSAVVRTAGFNSVDLGVTGSPIYLIMLFLMFVGGSPGSTAGGIKTTTLAVLALTFWTGITGHRHITVHKRRIPPATVYQAAAITFSGMLTLFATLLVLELTQQIPVRELAFEAVSALGTVGMSLGATGALDFAGKVVIMTAMFIGRVGPMTLFMLLSEERPASGAGYLDAHITLT
ncbi:MAG: potassium transporter TrkH [Acidobacteriota bacterium]|jgi:trk system potassium uptake protein TrkH|nr:potassium transporter TrkH [Acidobacteriota bacterium]